MSPLLALLTLSTVTGTRQKQHEIPETPPDVATSGSTHTKYRDWYKTEATLDSRDTP